MDEEYEIVRKVVEEFYEKNKRRTRLEILSDGEIEHVIDMGTEILLAKWDVRPAYGDFVRAFIDNNLRETFGQADATNIVAIHFYIQLSYNVGMPCELFNLINQ